MSENQTVVKEKRSREDILEIIIAIALGITALLTAWASWIGGLHGGNQAGNYAESNNLSAAGNAAWNEASQTLVQDMQIWNMISDYQVEIFYGDSIGDQAKMEEAAYKIQFIAIDNMNEDMAALIGYDFEYGASDIIDWVLYGESSTTSPFSDDDYVASYYTEAQEILDESEAKLAAGSDDNTWGDQFELVNVIYSVVLFMLGIVGVFKKMPNRYLVTAVAMVGFVIATVYMFTIPMPTGFSLGSFFGA